MALQGRVAAGFTLMVLHFFAYYVGDTVVLEDSGGHPFMMSLAILGGLWAFSNPLLGCFLGPTLLSLLSALGALHTELMGGSSSGAAPGSSAGGVGGGAPAAMLFSPGNTAGGGGGLFNIPPPPPPAMTTPEGGQVLAAPATMPRVSPSSASPTESAQMNNTPAVEASPAESVSLTGLAEGQYGADGVDGEVQSELLGGDYSGASGSAEVKKSGFSFRRKKQNVNFDTFN